jgi:hypothetical protein
MNAMTITVDSLLPRPKLDYDGGYNVAVKGLNVVVKLSSLVLRASPIVICHD